MRCFSANRISSERSSPLSILPVSARFDYLLALGFPESGKQSGRLPRRVGFRSARHQRGQVARPVAKLLVEPHMLRALRKGEEPRVAHSPAVKYGLSGLKQTLRHAAVPVLGQNGQRAKEAERSPARGDVRPDQASIVARCDQFAVSRAPARDDETAVTEKLQRIGHSQKPPKRQPADAVGFFQFAFLKRSDLDGLVRAHGRLLLIVASRLEVV